MKKYLPIIVLLMAVSLLGLSCKKSTLKNETPEVQQEEAKQETVNINLDSDNDGLIDTEEAKLGTNPNNPDTDGDGYNDGTEVTGGYDPLKSVVTTNGSTGTSGRVSAEDCGVSYTGKLNELVFSTGSGMSKVTDKVTDYDKDQAHVCMGKALMNNCQKAKMVVKSEGGTEHYEEIVNKSGDNCVIRVTYGEVKSADAHQKMYENSYIECEYPVAHIADGCGSLLEKAACDYFGIKNSPAHIYVQTIGAMMMTALFSPTDIKCSGNMASKIINASE